jgi:hypothetical protein
MAAIRDGSKTVNPTERKEKGRGRIRAAQFKQDFSDI